MLQLTVEKKCMIYPVNILADVWRYTRYRKSMTFGIKNGIYFITDIDLNIMNLISWRAIQN